MSDLPSYITSAKPVPWANRAPWYKTIAPTYAGIMLWFVFWQGIAAADGAPGGVYAGTMFYAFLGLAIAAVICHFLFYMTPAMLGMQTGLPLYVVGTSTYGARGGLYMPGFLMGLLQFGWLAVNAAAVGDILCKCFGLDTAVPGIGHGTIATVFAVVAALVGLKGIQYVARVATYLPLIPVFVLLVLFVNTCGGLGNISLNQLISADQRGPDIGARMLTGWGVISFLCIYVVGFFATAGAAGADIAMNSRNRDDVHIGGLGGVVIPTVLAGWAVMLIVGGAYGAKLVSPANVGNLNPVALMPDIMGARFANVAMIALAISSFPGACFSAFIAANSFKTTMPKVNPFLSVGIGTLAAVLLAVTGVAGKVVEVFVVIGASFGPICGAMLADFLLSKRRWSGPRAGFNPAGWISWIVGLAVGAFNLVVKIAVDRHWDWLYNLAPDLEKWQNYVPVPPVSALVVGFVLYLVLSLLGARTRVLEMPRSAG
jgi:cytosine permease